MALINRDWRSKFGLFDSASATQNKWNNSHSETNARTVSPGIFPPACSATSGAPATAPTAAFLTGLFELMELIASQVREDAVQAQDSPRYQHRPARPAISTSPCRVYAGRTGNMPHKACASSTASTTYMLPNFQWHSTGQSAEIEAEDSQSNRSISPLYQLCLRLRDLRRS